MTIEMLQSGIRVAGVVRTIGDQLSLTLNEELDLVGRNVAKWVGQDRSRPLGPGGPIKEADFAALAAAVLAGTVTPAAGQEYKITDGVMTGRVFEWNGESFGGFASQPIMQSFAPLVRSSVNGAGDATDANLLVLTFPGYVMRPNSKLRITSDWSYTNSASVKTLSTKLAGVSISGPTFTTTNTAKMLTEIVNDNSLTAQKIYNGISYGSQPNAYAAGAVDTRSPFTITFSCKWNAAAASESITLIGHSIELLP